MLFMRLPIQGFRHLAVVLACECRGAVSCDMFGGRITALPSVVQGNVFDKLMTDIDWHVVCKFLAHI